MRNDALPRSLVLALMVRATTMAATVNAETYIRSRTGRRGGVELERVR